MKPDIVVDVGNSRMKWGSVVGDHVEEIVALTTEDAAMWQRQLSLWKLDSNNVKWAVAGVDPQRRDEFTAWLKHEQAAFLVLEDKNQLPIQVQVDEPRKVGIDRLLNAVAANDRIARAASKVIVDAGSAVTVDWVDSEGVFRGGAIFPGLRLMGNALHDHTAKLPLVQDFVREPPLPGTNTQSAIQAGVYWAVAGGIQMLVRRLISTAATRRLKVFLTGGDATVLSRALDPDVVLNLWPEMTLEGIRIAAEAQP